MNAVPYREVEAASERTGAPRMDCHQMLIEDTQIGTQNRRQAQATAPRDRYILSALKLYEYVTRIQTTFSETSDARTRPSRISAASLLSPRIDIPHFTWFSRTHTRRVTHAHDDYRILDRVWPQSIGIMIRCALASLPMPLPFKCAVSRCTGSHRGLASGPSPSHNTTRRGEMRGKWMWRRVHESH